MHSRSYERVATSTASPSAALPPAATRQAVVTDDHAASGQRSPCCANQQHYHELLDLIPDVVLLTDLNGVIEEANAAVSALFGTARSFVLGKPLHAFVHAEHRASLAAQLGALGEARRRPAVWQGRIRSRRHEDVVLVAARIRPLVTADGAVTRHQWLLRDVSAALAQAERLATLERELEARVKARTAELEAVIRIQATQLVAARPSR